MVTDLISKQKNIVITLKQFIGYIGSGLISTVVHYVLLIYLVEKLASNVIIASTIGFLSGAITGFILNKRFVFCDPNAGRIACLKYLVLAATWAMLNIILLWIFTKLIHLQYLLAQIIITMSMVACNFMCSKIWIFNREKS